MSLERWCRSCQETASLPSPTWPPSYTQLQGRAQGTAASPASLPLGLSLSCQQAVPGKLSAQRRFRKKRAWVPGDHGAHMLSLHFVLSAFFCVTRSGLLFLSTPSSPRFPPAKPSCKGKTEELGKGRVSETEGGRSGGPSVMRGPEEQVQSHGQQVGPCCLGGGSWSVVGREVGEGPPIPGEGSWALLDRLVEVVGTRSVFP